MGSEQSTQHNFPQRHGSLSQNISNKGVTVRRQHTIANPGGGTSNNYDISEASEGGRPGSTSPGPSICSDMDLPYISYTVNRPIGDSPKLTSKPIPKSKLTQSRQQKPIKKSAHNIVVVKAPISGPNVDKDPDILTLQSIPMFLPIMRATLNLPSARDPEVLERLDPIPLQKLCFKYQAHLHSSANLVATEQNTLTQKIREIDLESHKILTVAIDKHKRYIKCADKLTKVQELSVQLNRCHVLLNETLELIETVNNYISVQERLEPFVWTTG